MSKDADRHVVVSGGGSGIGAELASQYAASGAAVTILGRRKELLESVAAETDALPITCDVTKRDSVDAALEQARSQHGPVSIAIANAGAAISKPFQAMTSEDVTSMMDVNVLGVFNLWQSSLNDMQTRKWGRMIAIASTAGLKGYPYVAGYCAAKHAVVGLTRALSLELARTGITVNALCPGFVETPMLDASIDNIVEKTGMSREEAAKALCAGNPMKRFIQVEEVASAALWLSARENASINGQTLSISGGET